MRSGLRHNNKKILFLLSLFFTALLIYKITTIAFNYHNQILNLRIPEIPIFRANPYSSGSYRLKPNLNIETMAGRTRIIIKTNSHGMPWREVPTEKTGDRKRIAFVGDSYTFGCWADKVENSFVGVFESEIPSGRFEVLNFGVGGYGLDDEELLIKEEVIRFKPDYIILMFANANDFRDTYLGTDKLDISSGMGKWRKGVFEKVPRELTREYWQKKKIWGVFDVRIEGFDGPPCFTEYSFWSRVPYSPTALQAKNMSLAALDGIKDLCAKNGMKLSVVAIPYPAQVYAPGDLEREFDLDYPQKYIEEWARKNGVSYYDLFPGLREYVKKSDSRALYLEKDPHFNNNGHYVAGKMIAEWFKEKIGSKEL